MKFLTLILAAVMTLTLALAAPVQAGLEPEAKCNVFRAKAEMKFAKCLKVANLLEAKGKTPDRAKCSDKYDQAIAKAKTKFVNDKLNVTAAECGLEQASTDAAKALDIVSAGEDLGDYGLDSSALAGTAADPTSNDQSVCEAANGTWEDGACTPAPVADRDCFREGLCGADGFNWGGLYEDVTLSSSGCDVSPNGAATYQMGVFSFDYYAPFSQLLREHVRIICE